MAAASRRSIWRAGAKNDLISRGGSLPRSPSGLKAPFLAWDDAWIMRQHAGQKPGRSSQTQI